MNHHLLVMPDKAIHSGLERQFINQFLQEQGYDLTAIKSLPQEQAKKLMIEASKHASSRLAEIEARSKFIQKIT